MRLRSVLGYLGMDVGAVGETQFFPLCRSENFKGPVFIYLFIYLFIFLGWHPWHMKVPRLRVESEL